MILGKGYLNKRTLLSVSSCGICGKQQLEDIEVHGNKIDQKISFSSESLLRYVCSSYKNIKKLLKKLEVVMLLVFLILILIYLPLEKILEGTML